jgi:hypothetical protein
MGVEQSFNSEVAGKRRTKRARVLLSAKLETPYGEIDCRLRDLSRKGALIESSPTPPSGVDVLFVRGTIKVPARVAWAQKGRVGLEFHYPIDEAEVLVQMKPGPAKPEQRFRRPGIREGISEQERKLAAAWGIQVGINVPDEDF